MRQRWLSALLTIPIFLGLVFWGTVPFAVAVLILAAVALGEMLRAYETAGARAMSVLVDELFYSFDAEKRAGQPTGTSPEVHRIGKEMQRLTR